MSWLFDAKDIERWGEYPASRAALPKLIRRLIFGYTDDLERNDFPGGSGVDAGGWDGIVEAKHGNAYVPTGISGWEVTTSEDLPGEATKNFKKRVEDSLGLEPRETTFVFVTSRVWSGKRAWMRTQQQNGPWRKVEAYDAEDLVAWLEQVPAEATLFAEQLGRPVDLVQSVVDKWAAYAEATEPPLTPDILLSGRDDDHKRFVDWLRGEPDIRQIRAESEAEAIAFAAASIESLDEEDREHHRSWSIFLERPEAWNRLGGRRSGLLVLLSGSHTDLAARVVQSGSHVALATTRSQPEMDGSITLNRPSRQQFEEALTSLGIGKTRAAKLARETGRSIGTLRRRLMPVPQQPEWHTPGLERAVIPALLAGRWDENEDRYADREVLEVLAGGSYEGLVDQLSSLTASPEAPIRRVGTVWSLTAPLDAFQFIGPHLRPEDCQRLKIAIKTVLLGDDPTLELPTDERSKAEIYEKRRRHSNWLRAGLTETLVLLSVAEERTNLNLGVRARDHAQGIVGELLRHRSDENIWLLLRNELPMLAEAAPEVFLAAVEDALDHKPPPVMVLFDDQDTNPLFTAPSHTGLLRALEKLAWNPDLLTQVALILVRLAELDPGGTWANRPMSSLREIFIPWLWNTSADFEQRLRSLDRLLQQHPKTGRTLLLSLLPKWGGQIATPNAGLRWRDWDYRRHESVLERDYRAFVIDIRARLIEQASTDSQHWPAIIQEVASFGPEDRIQIYSKLETVGEEGITSDTRQAIWTAIKKFVTPHRQYPTAGWALPEKEIDQLEELQDKFAPVDLASRHQDLFRNSPTLPTPRKESWREQEEAVEEAQIRAVREVLDAGGIQAILDFAQTVEAPYRLGRAVAKLGLSQSQEDKLLEASLASSSDDLRTLIFNYILAKAHSEDGSDWVAERLREAHQKPWSAEMLVTFFCGLPPGSETWARLQKESDEVREGYWSQANLTNLRGTPEAAEAVENLLANHRHAHALLLCWPNRKQLPAELVARVLERYAASGPEQDHRPPNAHEIQELLAVLRASQGFDPERLSILEWMYWEAVGGPLEADQNMILFKKLSAEPDFFVQFLTWIYRPQEDQDIDDEAANIPDENREVLGSKAFQVLSAWKGIPGLDSEGALNTEKLDSWIEHVRERLKKLGRLDVGDQEIGKILARAPEGADGIWPAEGVREILERCRSREIETGIYVGVRQSRGIMTGPGGDQVRELAQAYLEGADKLAGKWPRTAGVLRNIAGSYESEAYRWDQQEELDDL